MNILGISGQDRDGAAALIRDGVVVAAIEEEKLARVRHVGMSYSGGLPFHAVEFCLHHGGIRFDQLDYVAYYMEPAKLLGRTIRFRAGRIFKSPGVSSLQAFPYYFIDSLNGFRQRLKTRHLSMERLGERGQFVAVNHQAAHAASAFYPSGFERAAIIVAGNSGDMSPTSLMTGEGFRIEPGRQAPFPHSLGMVYSAVTAALGFGDSGEEHKTMWLAPSGEDEFHDLFQNLLLIGRAGLPSVNLNYFDGSFKGSPSLSRRFHDETGLKPRTAGEPLTKTHRNVAASLQARLDEVICEMASRLRVQSGEENLCLAGGVALNSLSNTAIEKRTGFKRLFIQPAAGNAGCSLGAALYLWHNVLGNRERKYEMRDLFLGPAFKDEEIKTVLDNCKLRYEYFLTEDKLNMEVATLLAKGNIVGWFRGPMEFGPRALGSRSILASPATEMMRENLNVYIKHREDFRPFSASVPEESASDFFEPSGLTSFLQGICRVVEAKRSLIPTAVFGDGIARVHTVRRTDNPSFWKLLVKFGEMTGVPVLVNTSFNLFGEPVVSNPREAVRGFFCSGLDCLAIENFLVKK
ncbi:MAG TPA: carbamoyltransferase C-terminal domain-containing protein [Blastocatellia bacterium]|nr:carbamoyltransferase C-terminal domain-containing protein [Blastocatellia bacterium]